jgi:hypothetical protein
MAAEKLERNIQVKKITVSLMLSITPEYFEPHSMCLHVMTRNMYLSAHMHVNTCTHTHTV